MSSYERLLQRIRQVRREWQLQTLAKGASLFLVSGIAMLILGVWGADLFGFKPAAVWTMRVVTGAALVYSALRFLLAPVRRRISDLQIAQYIEERYPQLEDRLVTAVEFGATSRISPGMLDLLIRDALDSSARLDLSVFLNRRRLAFDGSLGVLSIVGLIGLLAWGPSFFPYGFERLYVRWAEASGTPLLVQVAPGSIEVAKGTDQQVRAQLVGFDSPDVRLFVQPENGTSWTSSAMEPEQRGSGFLYLMIDLQASTRYYVEAKGVRSPAHLLKVVDLPRVERIDLTYRFPAYSGMPQQNVEGEGDLSGLRGTEVDLKIHLTQPAQGARLRFDNGSKLDLARDGKLARGTVKIERSGSYVVELAASDGRWYKASSEYQVDAVEDAPPKVTITKPLRDLRATNVEEVFSEVKAEDDIGVAKLELRYSVNGGEEKSVPLFPSARARAAQPSVTGTHTFFLEEMSLQPGDVVSYYGKAADGSASAGTSSSDIYFIEIRPFEQKYVQSQQGGMPGGGGGGADENLSRQQKEIISATFKLVRDKESMDPKEYVDSLKALALVQSRLLQTAQGLVARLQRRGAAEAGEGFSKLAEYLKTATVEMEKAAQLLGEQKPKDALPPEQKALQQLMRAESLFREIQVSFGNPSGGGGGGSQANAEDLADLFELELNKLKNQYETIQRGEQQARDQKTDEALERLKELAQRQQQINERNRMMGQRVGSSSASSGGGGGSQQQLLDEAEKLQRQLQRLSRERSSPELNRASSQLQQAIDQMKRAAQGSQRGNNQEAVSQGIRALQQLEDARRGLARNQDAGLNQGIGEAVEESKQLVEEQKRIQEGIDRLAAEKQAGGDSSARRRDLAERKKVLSDRVKNLGTKVDDLSRQARKSQRETSSKLADASGTIRDKKLPERILQGNPLLEAGYLDFMKGREDFIRGNLEEVQKQLESARGSLGQSKEGKLEDAVNRTRQLAEGLESMQQRMRGSARSRDASGEQGDRGQAASRSGQRGSQQGPSSQGGDPTQGDQQGQGQGQGRQGQQGQRGEQGQGERGQQATGATGGGGPGGNQQNPSGGRPQGDVRGLTGNSYGPPSGVGGYGDESYRQLRRDVQERLADAAELRRLMDRNSTQWQNLEQVIDALRKLDGARNYNDPEEAARLKSAITLLRQMEIDLDRDLAKLTQREKYFYSDDNAAPSAYRRLVEEYYKALAKGK